MPDHYIVHCDTDPDLEGCGTTVVRWGTPPEEHPDCSHCGNGLVDTGVPTLSECGGPDYEMPGECSGPIYLTWNQEGGAPDLCLYHFTHRHHG